MKVIKSFTETQSDHAYQEGKRLQGIVNKVIRNLGLLPRWSSFGRLIDLVEVRTNGKEWVLQQNLSEDLSWFYDLEDQVMERLKVILTKETESAEISQTESS